MKNFFAIFYGSMFWAGTLLGALAAFEGGPTKVFVPLLAGALFFGVLIIVDAIVENRDIVLKAIEEAKKGKESAEETQARSK